MFVVLNPACMWPEGGLKAMICIRIYIDEKLMDSFDLLRGTEALQCKTGDLYIFYSAAVLCGRRRVADHSYTRAHCGRYLSDVASCADCPECGNSLFAAQQYEHSDDPVYRGAGRYGGGI